MGKQADLQKIILYVQGVVIQIYIVREGAKSEVFCWGGRAVMGGEGVGGGGPDY